MPRHARHLALLLPALALAAPATATAATTHVVDGAGYGHGVGMSQYGALGFARQGSGYRDILAHYYRGTELGTADTRTVRVLLQASRSSSGFSGAAQAAGRVLDPRRSYRVARLGGGLAVRGAGGRVVARSPGPLTVTAAGEPLALAGPALNGVSGGRYRGALEFRPGLSGGVTVVNAIGLDRYVQGVVPGEVPPSWPAEALKAQAVAARTYALATDAGGPVFDQYPDTRSQVYRGVTSEQPSTNAAVAATAGEVLRYGGQIAVTYFFSTSGGRTENVENVFYGAQPTPYLVAVEDPFDDASPRHRWRRTFSTRQMQARLGGLVKGRFRRIEVTQRGVSPRVVWAEVHGTRGVSAVRGTELRKRLTLPDTWASFSTVTTRRVSRKAPASAAAPGRELLGTVTPAPVGRRLALERWEGRGVGWRAESAVTTSAGGGYRAIARRAGWYRVRAGTLIGPYVRVR